MNRQYGASRGQYGPRGLLVGSVKPGDIIYIQDGIGPFGPRSPFFSPVCREPWIVEAWLPRECMGRRMSGGHLAVVRSLRTGRRQQVADWLLTACADEGLVKH